MSEATPHLPSVEGEPAWEVAYFFPPQGRWSEEDFLQFHTNRMAELVDGRLEILPVPTLRNQRILQLLLNNLESAVPSGSVALFAPLPTRLFKGTIREPDLLYIAPENVPGDDVDYPSHLDLAVEIVSEGTDARKRDYEDKREDYAKAGIVDPQENRITVLVLEGDTYSEHGVFTLGETATGKLLPSLVVDVTAIMNA